ncbi:MAG: hypothetical protein SNF68_05250 [Rikenellaceae bacterium]
MKKVILKGLTLALMVAISSVCVAQPQQKANAEKPQQERPEREAREEMTPEEMAKKMTEKMKEELSLTAAQEKKVYAANLDFAKKLKEARDLQKNHEEALVGILNAEQTVKLFDKKKGGGKIGGQQGGPRRGSAPQQMRGKMMGKRPEGMPEDKEGVRPEGQGRRRPPMPKKDAECTECTETTTEATTK